MRTIITALVSIAFLAGIAGEADAASKRGKYGTSSSSIAERQRHHRTFDETLYYERLSERIPFGTHAWWQQKLRESARGG